MTELRVSSIRARTGNSPKLPNGAVVSGVTTSTSFSGSLTGDVTGDVVGNISGTTGTFSGNVSVGGTITYGDVANVDSIGIITARSGIKVGAGQSISAVSGNVTYYGDGSQLSGVESGVFNFTASGTLSNGQTVLINTDGTVSAVRQTVVADSTGTDQVWEADQVDYMSSVSIGGGKIVIAYQDTNDSNKGKAVVGTINNNKTISFGATAEFQNADFFQLGMCYDASADRVVLVYRNNSTSTPYGIVGQVSGTSISFPSSAVQVHGSFGGGGPIVLVHDSSVNRNVVFFRSSGNTGTSVVLSVSGTTLNVHNSQTFQSGQVQYIAACYDSNAERVVVGYGGYGISHTFRVKVGNVNATSVTYGNYNEIVGDWVFHKAIGFDSSVNKVIAYWADYNHGGNATNWGRAAVGTVNTSNDTISFGSEYSFADYNVNQSMSHTFDSDKNKNYLMFRNLGDGNVGTLIPCTISGNTISFGSTITFTGDEIMISESGDGAIFDPISKHIALTYAPYSSGSNNLHGTSRVFAPGYTTNYLTAENYIGIAAEAIADGAIGKITIPKGINQSQTGLTTGRMYYVQNNGSLSTSADNPSVVAGKAISSTKIVVS
jgi:hypothetical protein